MKFATFYVKGTTGKPTRACGSDSVLIIDGRFGLPRTLKRVRDWCKNYPKFIGFTLDSGESFTRSHETRGYEALRSSGGQ